MQVEVRPAEESTARLEVTLSHEEVDAVIDETYRRLAQRVRVPGFRPGKAPRSLLLRSFGDDAFYQEATDEALRRWYPKALSESGVEALDRGRVDLADDSHVQPGQEFSFAAIVTTKPEVNLPDYAQIRIPAPSTYVAEAEVDGVIQRLRESRAPLESAPARAAERGDVLTLSLHGRVEGSEVLTEDDLDFELAREDDVSAGEERLPGLTHELLGSHRGDIHDVTLSLPGDYRDANLAGQVLSLKVVVKEVKRKVLPELNDEFAQAVSRAATVSELRDLIRHNLEHERQAESFGKVANELMDSLIARTNPQPPAILIHEEMDAMLRDQRRALERRGIKFDQFLMAVRKSEADFREELRPAAERRVKRYLILNAIADAEQIQPSAEELDVRVRETSEIASRSERDRDRLTHSDRLRQLLSDEMRRRLTLEMMVERASGLKSPEGDRADAEDDSRSQVREDPGPIAEVVETIG